MISSEVKHYQDCAKDLLERIRALESGGGETEELKRLLKALIDAIKKGDFVQADYLIQLIEAGLQEESLSLSLVEKAPAPALEDEWKERDHGRYAKYRKYKLYSEGGKKRLSLPRWLLILIVIFLIYLGGVVVSWSLPDSPLYKGKLALENARVFFTPGLRSKAAYELSLARRRLKESEIMKAEGKQELAEQLRSDAEEHVRRAENWAVIANDEKLVEEIIDWGRKNLGKEILLNK